MIVVLWIIFAILVGGYASSKGRSGFGFFLIAALLSPLIGFIIALAVSPINSKVEQKALKAGDMKKCPSCAELVKAEAKLCKHCHSQLEVQEFEPSEVIKPCTNCGDDTPRVIHGFHLCEKCT